jgi:hypothetical protein
MSTEVVVAQAVATVASDKRGRVAVATILCAVIMLFFLPLIVYMGVMSNISELDIDTAQAQEVIVQNMSTEEKGKLTHLENVMNGIWLFRDFEPSLILDTFFRVILGTLAF